MMQPFVIKTCLYEVIMKSCMFCTHPKYYYAGQIKQNEVGGACGTHERGEESVLGFGGEARRKETTRKTEA
jgi:hypothetical protein